VAVRTQSFLVEHRVSSSYNSSLHLDTAAQFALDCFGKKKSLAEKDQPEELSATQRLWPDPVAQPDAPVLFAQVQITLDHLTSIRHLAYVNNSDWGEVEQLMRKALQALLEFHQRMLFKGVILKPSGSVSCETLEDISPKLCNVPTALTSQLVLSMQPSKSVPQRPSPPLAVAYPIACDSCTGASRPIKLNPSYFLH